MRIAITGASGLIGTRVAAVVRDAGHEVLPLRRGESWRVETGEVIVPGGGTADVLIHLAGRSIASRWTARVKKEIWDSRVVATEKLCQHLARLPVEKRPALLISASATGVYGSRGDEILDEESAPARPGESFLADVCRAWETATKPAEQAGIPVILPRIGVVLARHGGALAKLATPTKLFLGGPVGPGTQWLSWISLTDLGRLFLFLASEPDVGRGVVNAVAPEPVRQHEFIRTLGNVLHRPTVFPLPSFMVKLAFGQMGQEALLGSQRVVSRRIPRDFQFEHPTLQAAIEGEIAAR